MAVEKRRDESHGQVLGMVAALMNGERLDAKAVCAQFPIGEANAHRNLDAIAKFVPGVVKERLGRRDTYTFRRERVQSMKQREPRPALARAIAGALAAAFSRLFTGTPYQVELSSLRRDIIDSLVQSRQRMFEHISRKVIVISGQEELLEDRQALLDDVLEAVLNQVIVKMQYRKFDGTLEDVEIKPLSLAVYDGHIYVVALKNASFRTYRFSRIQSYEVTDIRFEYPAPGKYDPATLFRDSLGIWLGAPEPCTVRVRLDASWAIFAQHHRWHGSQQQETVLEDGSVILQFRLRPCPEFEQWVLQFGEKAEVLEPLSLRKTIAARLTEAGRHYEKKAQR